MPKRTGHWLERIRQCLPTLEKEPADDALEGLTGADVDVWRSEPELDHRRMDFGWRPKGPRRQAQDPLDVGQELDLDGHRPVVLTTRARHDPIRDLALHHQRRVTKQPTIVCRVQKSE